MKKLSILIILVFTFLSINANNVEYSAKAEILSGDISEAQVKTMADRVHEIQSMDLNELSPNERIAVKYELKDMHSKLKTYFDNGGIYIGGGTLLIIIILLILLL